MVKYIVNGHIMYDISLLTTELNVRRGKCLLKRCKWCENRVIPAKLNKGPESMFSNLLQIFTIYIIGSMREVFPENFGFIAQFNLNSWLFKVFEIVLKFPVCKFL